MRLSGLPLSPLACGESPSPPRGRGFFAALLPLLLLACAPAPVEPPKPALWKLADADTTIYLFGTIHLLPEGHDWRTPALDAAVRQSSQLVLEIAPGGEAAASATMMRMAVSDDEPTVYVRVPPEKMTALGEMLKKSGLAPLQADRLESWALALIFIGIQLREFGLSSANGVEPQLAADFTAARKPIAGLETTAQQFGFLDTLSEPTQRAFLAEALADPAEAKAELDTLIAAWTRGDAERVAIQETDEMPAEFVAALFDNRNAAWSAWLARRLDRPGTIMVAVGAAHLAGPGSVQALLAKRGLTVTRVQ